MQRALNAMNISLGQKNRLFIVIVVLTNTVGNLFLAIGIKQMPPFSMGSLFHYFLLFVSNGWILGGVALMATWMLSQLTMYSWADLTYVIPVTASAYILTAFLAKFVLGEEITAIHWTGICVISIGAGFVFETPLRANRDAGGNKS